MGLLVYGYASLALVAGYLLGSVPFGLLLTSAAGLGDVRSIGSGSIGATNVLRTGNKGLAALTLLLDALKGTAAVLLVYVIAKRFIAFEAFQLAYLAGLGAVVGHVYPVWLQFRGGKGVATYLGALLGLHPPAALVFCLIWGVVAAVTRYSSLASLTACAIVLLYYLLLGQAGWLNILLVTLLIFAKHRDNIERLLSGQESRIGAKP
jgi:acyl phosphate:glycerol-3-phosphate acyltransferase